MQPSQLLIPATFALLCFVGNADAADQSALANAKGCFACHTIDTPKIGPTYKAVAKKYAGQKDAKRRLVKKVLDGGSGVWGPVAEPANKTAGVTEADANKLVAWILSLK